MIPWKWKNARSARIEPVQRNTSLASEIRYPFWVLSLDRFFDLYERDDSDNIPKKMDAHQVLMAKGHLTEWNSIGPDATIMFISHEWAGWDHADPQGVQLRTLCKILRKLKDGKIARTKFSPWHNLLVKGTYETTRKEWRKMLRDAYIWVGTYFVGEEKKSS